jgi:hypothetical protein
VPAAGGPRAAIIFYGSPVTDFAVFIGTGMVISHGSDGGSYHVRADYRNVAQYRSCF